MINFLRTIQNLIKFFLFTNIRLKQFVFFSENRNYSNVFYPIIMKLLDKKIYVIYITSDKKDFFYNYENEYLISFYISKVIGQISLLNYIECRNLILTMPDLDNFHIKKSSKCRNYVYLFHSPVSTNMIYRNRAFFNYNKIFCVGEHHYKELTNYKKKFDLKDIDLFKGGYPKLDHLVSDYNNRKVKILKNKVTIAPSWGKKNILGNLNKNTLKEIWLSEISTSSRKKLISSNRSLSPCNVCDVSGELIGSSHSAAWKKFYHLK